MNHRRVHWVLGVTCALMYFCAWQTLQMALVRSRLQLDHDNYHGTSARTYIGFQGWLTLASESWDPGVLSHSALQGAQQRAWTLGPLRFVRWQREDLLQHVLSWTFLACAFVLAFAIFAPPKVIRTGHVGIDSGVLFAHLSPVERRAIFAAYAAVVIVVAVPLAVACWIVWTPRVLNSKSPLDLMLPSVVAVACSSVVYAVIARSCYAAVMKAAVSRTTTRRAADFARCCAHCGYPASISGVGGCSECGTSHNKTSTQTSVRHAAQTVCAVLRQTVPATLLVCSFTFIDYFASRTLNDGTWSNVSRWWGLLYASAQRNCQIPVAPDGRTRVIAWPDLDLHISGTVLGDDTTMRVLRLNWAWRDDSGGSLSQHESRDFVLVKAGGLRGREEPRLDIPLPAHSGDAEHTLRVAVTATLAGEPGLLVISTWGKKPDRVYLDNERP